ncbi:DUF4387 domain-containing protein [Pararhodobacter aggregans]|uniref:DUF4387 domain-containing protein n=2 Tax=Pararhodobacter aggregans TaxID=404875 RepID=A0A2T7UQJ7_9RHOB|nr:DUF4387 domain-containing protein [Pararhodobacter aggregans]
MMRLGDKVLKVRSKNAGPFWITIDIFCGTPEAFAEVSGKLETQRVADLTGTPLQLVKRFDIADLRVVKLSIPRPVVQGSRDDRDMHGAALAVLIDEMSL